MNTTITKKRFLSLLAVSIMAFSTILLLSSPAQAVQIKSIQRGVVNFDYVDLVASVSINQVDQSKSIVLLNVTGNSRSSNEQNWFFTTQFESDTAFQITRAGATAAAAVSWQVIEFEDGVRVQRGISSMTPGVLQKKILIASDTDLTKAVPVIQSMANLNNATYSQECYLLPSFITEGSDKKLQLDRMSTSDLNNKSVQISWQVVEFLTDASVQTNTTTLPVPGANTANQNVDSGITGVNNPLLFTYFNVKSRDVNVNYGQDAQINVDGEFTGAAPYTNVRFTRGQGRTAANSEVYIRYYVVDFTDPVSLGQSGSFTWTVPITRVGNAGISSSTDGTPIRVTFAAAHGLVTGDRINITNHQVTSSDDGLNYNPVDGIWTVTWVSNTVVSLNGSVAHGLGNNGGASGAAVKAQSVVLGSSVDLTRTMVIDSSRAISTSTRTDQLDDVLSGTRVQSSTTIDSFHHYSGTGNYSTSYSTFKALEFCPLTLKSPNGGEYWAVGTTQSITWKHAQSLETGGTHTTGKHRIKIDLSRNGGPDGYPLNIYTTPNPGVAEDTTCASDSFSWQVPPEIGSGNYIIGENLKVKITDLDLAARNYDTSNNSFIITAAVAINTPPNSWKIGETQNITWSYKGFVNQLSTKTVTIELSTDGSSWDNLVTDWNVGNDGNGLNGSGSYPWTIPSDISGGTKNLIGTDNQVRVTLNYNPSDPKTLVRSTSGNFTLKGQIYDVVPNSLVTWLLGENKTISWSKKGHFGAGVTDGLVNIYYSNNSGASYNPVAILTNIAAGTDAGGGSTAWIIPNATALSNPTSKLKVVQSNDDTVFAESAEFNIKGSLDITFPTPAEMNKTYRWGDTIPVKWVPHGTIGNGQLVIKYKIGAGGWNYVPGAGPGDNVPVGTAEEEQTKNWVVDNPLGDSVTIRVCSETEEDTVGDEFGPINLKTKITVTEPHNSEIVSVTEGGVNTKSVEWNTQGSLSGNARISYSSDGNTWTQLVTGLPFNSGNNSYVWTVLPEHRGTRWLKVGLAGDDALPDGNVDQSAEFQTVSYLQLTYPNESGLTKSIGEAIQIRWTPNPENFGTVNLRYDNNSGSNGYTGFIQNNVLSNNKPDAVNIGYDFTIPPDFAVGNKFRIKVYQTGNEAAVHSESDYDFKIKGTVSLTGASDGVGNPTWKIGETKNITWDAQGNLGTVDILCTRDGSTFDYTIASDIPCTATGSYIHPWAIPGASSVTPPPVIDNDRNPNIKLQVIDASGEASDISANPIVIEARILNVSPGLNPNMVLRVDELTNITWSTRDIGNVGFVKLRYDTNSGDGGYNNCIDGCVQKGNVDALNNWTVPNAIGNKLRLKVYSADASAQDYVLGTSANDFEIKGNIDINAPTAANINANALKVHSAALPYSFLINWDNHGNMGTVNIYYATDGIDYQLVTTATGAHGDSKTYSWQPPATWSGDATIGTTNKIKITDADDEDDVLAESAAFEIKGQLAIKDTLLPVYAIGGDPIELEWDYAGDATAFGNIRIYFSSDNGGDWGAALATIPVNNAQPYNLSVPNAPTSQGRIKIEQVSDSSVSSVSDQFRVRGDIKNVAVSGAPWKVNNVDTNLITWEYTGAILNASIWLDTESGTNNYPVEVVATTANDGSYTWNIPVDKYVSVTTSSSPLTDKCRIKVSDAADPTVFGTSADFSIKPVVWVIHPQSSGDSWEIGANPDITWDYLGIIANVKIQFSDDNGGSWPEVSPYLIEASATASDKSYPWSVPDKMSAQCLVRISKVGDASVTDNSNSNFIIKPKFVIDQPLGGAIKANSTYAVKWTTTGTLRPLATVKLQYSVNNGTDWNDIPGAGSLASPAGQTTYNWAVPDVSAAAAKVRVVSNDNVNVKAESNAFSLRRVRVVSPNGSEHWAAGTPQLVTWSTEQVGTVQVFYSINGGSNWNLIGSKAGSDGSIDWNIAQNQQVSQNCLVKVEDLNYPEISDVSDAAFDVKAYLDITSPLTGQNFVAEVVKQITWTRYGTGVDNVILQYKKGSGSWNYVNPVDPYTVPNSGSYNWPVPANALSDQVTLKITDPSNAEASDEEGTFWIKGEITVTDPRGGESWNVGTAHTVNWTKKGDISFVSVYYSPNNGTDEWTNGWTLVGSDISGSALTWSWPIDPDAPLTTQGKIRVADQNFPLFVYGTSANNFEVKGNITGVTPSGGVLTYAGPATPMTVNWTKQGAMTTVKILYSTNGTDFPDPANLLGEAPAGNETASVTMPNAIGTNLKIKVVDKNNPNVWSVSAAPFAMKGSVHLDIPNGGQGWAKGTTQQVKWTPTGSYPGNVKLEYSKDGGLTWMAPAIATPGAGASGVQQSQNWVIPDQIDTDIMVKVSTQTGSPSIEVEDVSDEVFNIIGTITLDAPNGANLWYVGETTRTIDWSATGTVTPVKIEYSVNNGGAWTELTHTFVGAEGSNSYSWNPVPNEKSDICLVRISDARPVLDALTTDTSAAVFYIRPQITVSQPAAGANIPAASNNIPVNWSITGNKVNFVNIQYNIDGAGWVDIDTGVDASLGGSYEWDGVPATKSTNVRVRVVDADNGNIVGQSGVFNIVGNLRMDILQATPLSWEAGTTQYITWTSTAVTTVEAYYSLNGGANWTLIGEAPGAGSSLTWNIPAGQPVNHTTKLKVCDKSNPTVVKSESLQPLDLRARFVLGDPLPNTSLVAETVNPITWTAYGSGVTSVMVEYSKNNGSTWNYVNLVDPYTVSNSVGANQYNWSVPADALSSQCKIRIYDPDHSSYKYGHEVLETFWIKGEISSVTSPGAGTSWSVGTPMSISWTKKGNIAKYSIFYSSNNGGAWSKINTSDVTASPWVWNIPVATTLTPDQGKIRVADENFENFVQNFSPGNFEVKGAITDVAVSGGVGNVFTYDGALGTNKITITWDFDGAITNVSLACSVDGGADNYPITIDTVNANLQTYDWKVPNRIGNNLKIRVKDAAPGSTVAGYSGAFKIKGSLSILEPTNVSSWLPGSPHTIRWKPTGTYTGKTVKIEYTHNGTDYVAPEIATPSVGADDAEQSQNWTVPDTISTTCKVRLTTQFGDADIDVSAVSDTFTIKGQVVVNQPASGAVWNVATNQEIRWTSTGTVSPVKIQYDAGSGWQDIEISYAAAAGLNIYTWNNIPGTLNSESCFIKVTDSRPAFSDVTDTSDQFSIRPVITVTQPVLGADVPAQAAWPLHWSVTGSSITNVKLQYQFNGPPWVDITTVAVGQGATYNWTNSFTEQSANVKVRVVDNGNANVLDESDTFNVIGNLVLTAPNGGEHWAVDESHTITWTSKAVNTVKAYYSLNGVDNWQVIGEAVGSNGNMPWAIPDSQTVSNTAKVKLTDKDHELSTFDISAASFDILAKFIVDDPVEGHTVVAESPYAVRWTPKGSGVLNAILEYSTDNGENWNYFNPVAPYTVENNGNYPVASFPGSVLSEQCKIRVTDPNNSLATATGTGTFWLRGSLTITSPTLGNESWGAGTKHNITWTKKGNIGNISIWYSTNSGASWGDDPIVITDGNAGTWEWNIPQDVVLTTDGRIKIQKDAYSAIINSVSANDFTVRGSVAVVTPNTADVSVAVDDTYSVTFNAFGAISQVDFYLSDNGGIGGGGSYPLAPFDTMTGVVAGLNSYSWQVPDEIGKLCRIKVQDHNNPAVFDESDANFEIKGKVTVLEPNTGNETWYVGDSAQIKWKPEGTYLNVKIEYSTNGFSDESQTYFITQTSAGAPGVEHAYTWAAVDPRISDNCKVRVSDPNSPTVADISDNPYKIRGKLVMTAPGTGEMWYVGSTHDIEWNTVGPIPFVDIDYYASGGWNNIFTNIANINKQSWSVPAAPDGIGNSAKLRVSDHRYPAAVYDESDTFKVRGRVLISHPNASDAWPVFTTRQITWTTQGTIPTVYIYYSSDGGSSYYAQAISTTASGGSCDWNIPDTPGTQTKVKIFDPRYETDTIDYSPNFRITGSLTLTKPVAGELIMVGTQDKKIEWNQTGTIARKRIELSADGGANYDFLVSDDAGSSPFFWDVPTNIPGMISPNCKLRISDFNDPTVLSESQVFHIIPVFSITVPSGGQVYTSGDSCPITWTTTGTCNNVKIEYSLDGGNLDWNVIKETQSNTGTCSWSIPAALSTQVRVRISDVRDYPLSGQLNQGGDFVIRGTLTITEPDPGDVWVVDSPVRIEWDVQGPVENVKLEFSDDGVTYGTTIINSWPAAPNKYYDWTCPNAIGSDNRVRISDPDNITTLPDDSGDFIIRGSLTVVSPNGPADQWQAGTNHNITWEKHGGIQNVEIRLSTNGGSTYATQLIPSTPAGIGLNGSWSWAIPNDFDLATNLKIKVIDVGDPSNVSDVSDGLFGVIGALQLNQPSGVVWYVDETNDITWTRFGKIGSIAIDISTDGGTNYTNLVASTDATGTPANSFKYSWQVGNFIGTNNKIRIKDTSNPDNVYAVSSNPFTIKGVLDLTYPNGAETLIVGDPLEVLWTPHGTINNVRLDYSNNGGGSYSTWIATTPAMSGKYTGTVPDYIGSNNIRFKVLDVLDMSRPDESAANFTIKGKLILQTPTTAVAWPVETNQNITWDYTGTLGNILIEYTTDNFGSTTPIATVAASTRTRSWNIPDDINSTAKVRISTVTAEASVPSQSPVNFKIVGQLQLTAPTAASRWEVGLPQTVSWTKTGSMGDVRIDYSKNNGTNWTNIAQVPAGQGNISYVPIDSDVTIQAKVRVVDAVYSEVSSVSDAFQIKARFSVTSPTNGDIWAVGSPHAITWNTVGNVSLVKIWLSTDGGTNYELLVPSTGNTGSYPWTVTDDISTTCKIKVSDFANDEATGESVNFKIRGDIVVTVPSESGIAWIVDSSHDIEWSMSGTVPKVNIYYDTGTNQFLKSVVANIDGALRRHTWTVPDDLSTTCKVRVYDKEDSTVYGTSSNTFEIRGQLAVDAPIGTDQWEVNSSQEIRWHRVHGNIQNIKIEYSTDGGSHYDKTIIPSIQASLNSLNWTVEDPISSQCIIRISDVANPNVTATSAQFRIKGKLAITRPDASSVFVYGTNEAINWNVDGNITLVKLEYSKDNGAWTNIVASTNAQNRTYTWTSIPDILSGNVKVRITNLASPDVLDDSEQFKVVGTLSLVLPGGGEVWAVGSTQAVSWTRGGSVQNVGIKYAIDGVNFDYTIRDSVPAGTGSVNYVVDDHISNNVKVKVYDIDNPTLVYAVNTNPIFIRGDLVLTRPLGGELFLINNSENITWDVFGSISNAVLEYSVSGAGGPWINISTVPADSRIKAWSVPNNPTTLARVKISDAANPLTVYNISPANFIIRGGFVLQAPNGNERWAMQSQQFVTWQTFGSYAKVDLYLSTNPGNTIWNLFAGNIDNSGNYLWTINQPVISNTCKVRVVATSDSEAKDESDATFKIHGVLVLNTPNGGQQWAVDSKQNITWDVTGPIATVKLEYSRDNFVSDVQLINDNVTAANEQFEWTIPNSISKTVKVRISDASDADVNDVSENNFTIKGGIVMLSPIGNEEWVVDDHHNISWETHGTVPNVTIELSKDSGVTWETTKIATNIPNSSPFDWQVSNVISSACRVRVSDALDSMVSGSSPTDFKIRGNLILQTPNGSEKWPVATAQLITWQKVGGISKIDLQFSDDGGTTYYPIASNENNTGSYSWTIPPNITLQALVKIIDHNDPTVLDVSNGFFKIQPSFVVTSPNGTESWAALSRHNITWTWNGAVASVNLYYSKSSGADGTWVLIEGGVANNGLYDWLVPADSVAKTDRIKVASSSDAEAFDISNSDFIVRCSFVLQSPNGTEHWRVGQTRNITWTKVGNPAAVKLEYSRDDFMTDIHEIASDVSPNSPYPWTIPAVPDPISNALKVRISDMADAGANDVSNADFRITGDFTLTAPNGSEDWPVDSAQNITWTSRGNVADVLLEYSTNGGALYDVIGAFPNTGSRAWSVPNTATSISPSCRVRISDFTDSTANDISDANFNIVPVYTLTSPNGGQIWTVNESHPVTWTCLGTVANVRLDYAIDGVNYNQPIIASTPNDGSYDWDVPDNISSQVKVRVMSATAPFAWDASNANLKIRGALRITAPNGSEQWNIDQVNRIQWVTTGTINNVQLRYSTDSGGSFPDGNIIISKANSGFHDWTIPDTRTPNARVRVIDSSDDTVYDDSDANFSIQGFLTLNSPNGAEAWTAQDVHPVTWTWGGTLPFVKISYSIDGGVSYDVVEAAAPNGAGKGGTHSYNWTVPNTLTLQARVKVEDPDNPLVADASDADFRIRGEFNITAPVGGERWVTNETHQVAWTHRGTIANVKLEYSTDNFGSPAKLIIASTPNLDLYDWKIPDDRADAVRVRVSDVLDADTYDVSNAFKIDYYKTTWYVRDLLTIENLTNLAVTQKTTGGSEISWQAVGLTSPVVEHATPYGFWTAVWSSSGYGDKGVNFTADKDQSFDVYLETTAVHIWRSEGAFTYNPDNDSLKVTAWLERDGSMVPGVSAVYVSVYNMEGTLLNPYGYTKPVKKADGSIENVPCTLRQEGVPPDGYFRLSWDNTNLEAGVVYSTIMDIRNASGAGFSTPTSFSITETKRLAETEAAVKNMENVTLPAFQVGIQNTINNGIQEQKQTISDIMVGRGGDPETIISTGGMVGMLTNSLTTFETRSNEAITRLQSGADTAVAAGKELQATAKKYSWAASASPDPALAGDIVTLRLTGQPNLTPLLEIRTWDNNVIVTAMPMIQQRLGSYVYEFKADTRFTPGKAYTYTIAEQVTGGFVAGSAMVESMGITTVAGLAAAAPEAERAAKKALDAIKAVESVLVSQDNINIAMTLQNLKQSVDDLPSVLSKDGPDAKMLNAINDISEKLKGFMGEEGVDIGSILDEKLGDGSSMKQIRNKTDSIGSIVDLLLQILEARLGGVDAPIISTSLQSGSVKFRIVVVNPSKMRTQKVQVKKYLAAEVKPKDVMDLGQLELEYDSEKGIYYVYKNDVELGPGESKVYEVEVEDIWIVPEGELKDVKSQTEELVKRLEKTVYADRAKEAQETIYPVLEEIARNQVDETVSREQHIGYYRQNVHNIQLIKDKLVELEKLLQPKPGVKAPELLERSKLKVDMPSKTTTWLIIMVVMIFLGLLAAIFFFVNWQNQVKSSQAVISDARKQAFAGSQKPPEQKK